MNHAKPPFDVPVLYEDDHFAAINKPAGYVVHGNGATIRSVLPFCLKPPRKGTWAVLRRPIGVHRLDKPTSGILLSAKTRPAMVDLARQFSQRVTKKTYLAIVNGIPPAPPETSISSRKAYELGVDVDPNDESSSWQLVNFPLDDKASVTVWRALRCVPSRNANDGHVTLVELKPKTGRFHQLRRHMVSSKVWSRNEWRIPHCFFLFLRPGFARNHSWATMNMMVDESVHVPFEDTDFSFAQTV